MAALRGMLPLIMIKRAQAAGLLPPSPTSKLFQARAALCLKAVWCHGDHLMVGVSLWRVCLFCCQLGCVLVPFVAW